MYIFRRFDVEYITKAITDAQNEINGKLSEQGYIYESDIYSIMLNHLDKLGNIKKNQ
jgi:hypothetical protein